MADLEGKVNEVLIHLEYVREKIDTIEQARKDSQTTFWGNITEMRKEIGAIKTEMGTMKIKIGGVVIIVSTLITGVFNWALRQIK